MSNTELDTYDLVRNRLNNPDDWDVAGMIQDVTDRLTRDEDAEAVAVIDHLVAALRQVISETDDCHLGPPRHGREANYVARKALGVVKE